MTADRYIKSLLFSIASKTCQNHESKARNTWSGHLPYTQAVCRRTSSVKVPFSFLPFISSFQIYTFILIRFRFPFFLLPFPPFAIYTYLTPLQSPFPLFLSSFPIYKLSISFAFSFLSLTSLLYPLVSLLFQFRLIFFHFCFPSIFISFRFSVSGEALHSKHTPR